MDFATKLQYLVATTMTSMFLIAALSSFFPEYQELCIAGILGIQAISISYIFFLMTESMSTSGVEEKR